jgi:hypothetical protein
MLRQRYPIHSPEFNFMTASCAEVFNFGMTTIIMSSALAISFNRNYKRRRLVLRDSLIVSWRTQAFDALVFNFSNTLDFNLFFSE